MNKISFQDFERIMSCDLLKKKARKVDPCIEIEFCVDDCAEYEESWMGKMLDKETNQDVYWYGLTPDCLQAYDYGTLEEFLNAKVFHGRSIKEIWDSVSLYSLDGGPAHECLPFYLDSP